MKEKVIKLFFFASAFFGMMNLYSVNKAESGSSYLDLTQQQQIQTIKGRVTDLNGEPMIGVSIVELGRLRNGTITDMNGRFSIDVQKDAVLRFSFMGYLEREMPTRNSKELNVILQEDTKLLDEVVVVGYGVQRKTDLTGSVGVIRAEELTKAPVTNFDQALAGRIAGVQIVSSDGQPGSVSNIIIRGGNSLTQSNDPLYVVDGFPIENLEDLSINPNDIESMNVLKDASSTAIYGARGANGVIVITTKQNKGSNKTYVSYDGYAGLNSVTNRLNMMSPYDFVVYQREINQVYADQIYLFGDRTIDSYRDIKGINWQDQLFRNGFYHSHNLSVRGGDKTRFNLSASLLDQEGSVINTGYKKNQLRLNINHDTKNVNFWLGGTYSYDDAYGDKISSPGSTTYNSYLLFRTWSYRPVKGRGDGDLLSEVMDPESATASTNPIIDIQNTQRNNRTENLQLNSFVNFILMKGLELKIRGGYTRRISRDAGFYNSLTSRGSSFIPSNTRGVNAAVTYFENINILNENTLTYKAKVRNHSFTNLLGWTYQTYSNQNFGFTSEQIPNENLGLSGMDQGLPGSSQTALIGENKLMSFLGRFDYNYKDRYIATATFRADGSSKFAPENRWGYFPSVAFAWNFGNENFMKSIPAINGAKLRSSFGVIGNNRIGDYTRYSQLTQPYSSYFSFGNSTPLVGLNISTFGNNSLKWEKTQQMNVGIDLYLLKNRINIIVDAYYKKTNDLLLSATVPYTTGFSSIYKNIGSVGNKGLELTLTTINIKRKGFVWESNFNISFNKNKILSLTDDETRLLNAMNWSGNFSTVNLYVAEKSKSTGMFYGLIWDGVFGLDDFDKIGDAYTLKLDVPTNGNSRSSIRPGDIKYRDIDGDGQITVKDNVIIGRGLPIHTGGFNNDFSYKNFSLNIFFQWSYGNDIMNANRIYLEGNVNNSTGMNQLATYTDRWTTENTDTKLYRVGGHGPNGYYSTRTLEDGSYLRLKTVKLSYRLPNRVSRFLYARSIDMYLSAQNLYTWTNYSGMDPEVSLRYSALTPGFDFSTYPQAKTMVFGVKIDF